MQFEDFNFIIIINTNPDAVIDAGNGSFRPHLLMNTTGCTIILHLKRVLNEGLVLKYEILEETALPEEQRKVRMGSV